MKLTTRCGPAAVDGLNEALLAKAAEAKLLRTTRLRADTTVVPANVAYPTDSGSAGQGGPPDRGDRTADPGRRRREPHQGAGPVPRGRASGRTRSAREAADPQRRRAGTRRRPRCAGSPVSWPTWPRPPPPTPNGCWATPSGRCAGPGPRPPSWRAVGARDAAAGRRRGRLARAVNDLTELVDGDPADRRADPAAAGRADPGRRHPAGQPARPRRPPDRQGPARASRSSSGTRPRSSTTTTASCWTTPSSRATRRRTAARPGGRAGHRSGPAARRAPSPPTAATASRASTTHLHDLGVRTRRHPPQGQTVGTPAEPTNTDQRSDEP